MGELAVFVPGNCTRNKSALIPLGLGALLDERVSVSTQDGPGPNGLEGVHFRFAHDHEPGYMSRPIGLKAHWVPLVKSGDLPAGRAFIGWHDDDPPGPSDLARRKLEPGKPLRLHDGYDWLIPIAKQLPHVLRRDAEGKAVGSVITRYRDFYATALSAVNWFTEVGDGKVAVDMDLALPFAFDTLAINYRIVPEIVEELGLIRSDLLFEFPRIVIEWDALVATLQKKTADTTEAESSTPTPAIPCSGSGESA